MRKLHLSIIIIIAASLAAGCTADVDAVNERLDDLESRLEAMETVLDAYESGLSISEIAELEDGSGYTITFSDGSTVVIKHGNDGADGETLIDRIDISDMGVTFYLTDGTEFFIPMYNALTITFDAEDLLVMEPNSERNVHYTIESQLKDISIEIQASEDIDAKVISSDLFTGVINIKTSSELTEYSKVVVLVTNGEKMLMRTITFEEAELYVADESDVSVGKEGGCVQLLYMSNMECEVSISPEAQSWISVSQTKALEEYALFLLVSVNEDVARKGTVVVGNPESLHITYTINQAGNVSQEQLDLERDALVAIYSALDGPNWSSNENWCSDKPVGEWAGVRTDENGNVVELVTPTYDDGICGSVPDEIYNLTSLRTLMLSSNNLRWEITSKIENLSNLQFLRIDMGVIGVIPKELYDLADLENVNLSGVYGACSMNLEGISKLKQLKNLSLTSISLNSIHEEVCELKELESLSIALAKSDNNLMIPLNIGNLSNLRSLDLSMNDIVGEIPESIGECGSLERLFLGRNRLSGTIPPELSKCTKLRQLILSENMLSGEFPKEFVNLKHLVDVNVAQNRLYGKLDAIAGQDFFVYRWGQIISSNIFDTENLIIKAPEFSVVGLGGEIIDSENEYSNNRYTLLIQGIDICEADIENLKKIYAKYHEKGLEIVFWDWDREKLEGWDMPWKVFQTTGDQENCFYDNGETILYYYPLDYMGGGPVSVLIGHDKTVCWSNKLNSESLEEVLSEWVDGVDLGEGYYTSADYSADGEVEVLQSATKGNGIDIVLMGDAYSDRLISDGTYKKIMVNTMELIFSEEPLKSFRDYFNVYMVNVVSENEIYADNAHTSLSTWFGEGTVVGGYDYDAFAYALRAIPPERLDEALVVVMMNVDRYAGTCYMYYPDYGNYGNGVSVAYFPTSKDPTLFKGLVLHESVGHGFAKLADEYAYEEYGQIPSEEITNCQNLWNFGWFTNVDFTSDLSLVNWAEFIADERYQYDGLGAFEGGFTYWTGVWRPTENSIMRYNEGCFNAPSREAIYIRINKLAYGADWQYDYEDFVTYDAVNRRTQPTAAPSYVRRRLEPTAPPVIVRKTWREAMDENRNR